MASRLPRRSSSSKLLAALRNIGKCKSDKVPDGVYSAKQWGKMWNLGPSETQKLLKNGLEHGHMKCYRLKIRSSDAGVRLVPHYGEKPAKTSAKKK